MILKKMTSGKTQCKLFFIWKFNSKRLNNKINDNPGVGNYSPIIKSNKPLYSFSKTKRIKDYNNDIPGPKYDINTNNLRNKSPSYR